MLFVVNTSLKMQKGKVAAQCGHAAIGCFEIASIQYKSIVRKWQQNGARKIACKIGSDEEIDALKALLDENNIPTYQVVDAGYTQVPSGSKTVLGIGPMEETVLNNFTGDLKLY
jgi:peptidyl-tRNA hydrolase, PTH2 family